MCEPKIGEVYYANISGEGSVQNGMRPCIIFQNNVGNKYSPNVVVIPLTTAVKKMGMPTHVYMSSRSTGLARDSIALCENPVSIPKNNLKGYLISLPNEQMKKIAMASILASSAISFLSASDIDVVREKALSLV